MASFGLTMWSLLSTTFEIKEFQMPKELAKESIESITNLTNYHMKKI